MYKKYGYIYYSTDYGQTWTQSSGITGAPSKSWIGVSMTKNFTSVEVGSTGENSTSLFYPEGYIQIAVSKEGKLYVSKFDNGKCFLKLYFHLITLSIPSSFHRYSRL